MQMIGNPFEANGGFGSLTISDSLKCRHLAVISLHLHRQFKEVRAPEALQDGFPLDLGALPLRGLASPLFRVQAG